MRISLDNFPQIDGVYYMQQFNQNLSFYSEVVLSYLDLQTSPLELFNVIENLGKQVLPSSVDRANYLAIKVLEKLNLNDPEQDKISAMETFILLTEQNYKFLDVR